MKRSAASTSRRPEVTVSPVVVADVSKHYMSIPVSITCKDRTIETNALIDSGAGGLFIDESFARKSKLPLLPIPHPISVFNIDGTPNVNRTITHKIMSDLIIAGDKQKSELLATPLGKDVNCSGLGQSHKGLGCTL